MESLQEHAAKFKDSFKLRLKISSETEDDQIALVALVTMFANNTSIKEKTNDAELLERGKNLFCSVITIKKSVN